MSDIFSGLNSGIRFPDAAWNQGPTPPENVGPGGAPQGGFGFSSKINYNSALLGGIGAYDYGTSDRVANDISYQNIANRVAKLVPIVTLPGPTKSEEWITITHPVDDGDIAFVLRDTANRTMLDRKDCERFYTERNCNVFINLATVNYILAGVQLYLCQIFIEQHAQPGEPNFSLPESWAVFLSVLGIEAMEARAVPNFASFLNGVVANIMSNIIIPFGIPHGSEKQGGNHEGVHSVVTWASNFVTTMFTDGYVRNMVNIWRQMDCSAGDSLGLRLHFCEINANMPNNEESFLCRTFTLNHYPKATVRKRFGDHELLDVLTLYRNNAHPIHLRFLGTRFFRLQPVTHFPVHYTAADPFQRHMPYWKIALLYVRHSKHTNPGDPVHDDTSGNRGALLEASFAPALIYGRTTRNRHFQHFKTPMHLQAAATQMAAAAKPQPSQAGSGKAAPPAQRSGGMDRYQKPRGALGASAATATQPASAHTTATEAAAAPVRVPVRDESMTFEERVRQATKTEAAASDRLQCSDKALQSLQKFIQETYGHEMQKHNFSEADIVNHIAAVAGGQPEPVKTRGRISLYLGLGSSVLDLFQFRPHHSGTTGHHLSHNGDPAKQRPSSNPRMPMTEADLQVAARVSQNLAVNDIMSENHRMVAQLRQKGIVTGASSGSAPPGEILGRQKRTDEGTDVHTWYAASERGMKRYAKQAAALQQQRTESRKQEESTGQRMKQRQGVGITTPFRPPKHPATASTLQAPALQAPSPQVTMEGLEDDSGPARKAAARTASFQSAPDVPMADTDASAPFAAGPKTARRPSVTQTQQARRGNTAAPLQQVAPVETATPQSSNPLPPAGNAAGRGQAAKATRTSAVSSLEDLALEDKKD